MAEEKGVSPFPNPPSLFYKLYTDENVKAGLASKPPRPTKGEYHMFGQPFNTDDAMVRPLEDQNIKRLYPQEYDKKVELKKLNRSIVVCFLELLDILINNPASPARNQKIADLSYLFINMHHLVNEFRPHQARETLKVIMERQKKQREEMITQVQRATDKACSILKECSDSLTLALNSIPQSERIANGVGSSKEEKMDIDSSSTATSTAVSLSKVSDKDSSSLQQARGFVEMQDAELCSLIDSLISGTPT